MAAPLELVLAGPRGEPVDLWRTFLSHGVADLPPGRVDEEARAYETTVALPVGKPRTVRIRAQSSGVAAVDLRGPRLAERARPALLAVLRRVLNLDEDLSAFYEVAAADPELAWAAAGAGRMVRSPTVFEDVVKTICTTNCAWSATQRMVTALVDHLGDESAGGHGRAFPTPAAMAAARESFYRNVARTGYRGAYLRSLAASVAARATDLEELREAPPQELPDEEVERRLLALPGVGPYAAAHVMMLLGRHSRLILDSWTRPKYARLNGGVAASDVEIVARFAPYGRFAGLAFWLYLTRDWVADDA
ncbi:MAG: Fe-S cluster assembly protein HesB [Thermoleophilia bacterium]|nr:Fe-S cluster assembly protein HesB [Thermoleophilia bacterium]